MNPPIYAFTRHTFNIPLQLRRYRYTGLRIIHKFHLTLDCPLHFLAVHRWIKLWTTGEEEIVPIYVFKSFCWWDGCVLSEYFFLNRTQSFQVCFHGDVVWRCIFLMTRPDSVCNSLTWTSGVWYQTEGYSGLTFKYTCSLPFAPTIVHAMMSPSLPRRALAASARLNTSSWALKSSLFVVYELAEAILARRMMLSRHREKENSKSFGFGTFSVAEPQTPMR